MDPSTEQPVELYFPAHNVSVIALLLAGRPDGAVVQLAPPPPAESQIPAGLPCFIAFPTGAMVLQTPSRVVSYSNGALTLKYAGDGRLLQRRRNERVPCSLAVAYRAIRDGKSYGAWKQAQTEDISEGGVALIAEGHIQFPPQVDMYISFPSQGGWCDNLPDVDEIHLRGNQDAAAPARFSGNSRHGSFRPDGTTLVGVKFSGITPVARLRLSRFLETTAGRMPRDFQDAA